MQPLVWKIENIKWSDLRPYEYNARKIKSENKKNLTDSLDEFGVAVSPTADFDNVLIGGHQRWRIQIDKGLGDELVPVMKPNRKLTESEFKKLNLLLNSHKFSGEYDVEMLNEHFQEFEMSDFGIDLSDMEDVLAKLDEENEAPEMEIVPKFSESYNAIIIVCENEIDFNHLAEKVGLEQMKCYKNSRVGLTQVVRAEKVIQRWT